MKFNGLSVIALGLVMIMTACVTNKEQHGYTFDKVQLDQVKEGVSSQNDVLRLLGTPTTESNFGTKKWYYISTKSERVAFLDPKVKDHKILAITFNDSGNVSKIDRFTSADIKELNYAQETTPTFGNDMNVLEQFIGNIGKFNPASGGRPGASGE